MKRTVVFDMHQTIYQAKPGKNVHSAQQVAAIESMPGAMETFFEFYQQGYKIIIISTSAIQDSRDRLQYLFQQQDLDDEQQAEIFADIDILSMRYFGSKHSVEAWEKAMQAYDNIEYIFEDGENKLQAAGEAARKLGHDPQLYLSVTDYLQQVEQD